MASNTPPSPGSSSQASSSTPTPTRSPPRNGHPRTSSVSSIQQHRPTAPSGLRRTTLPPPSPDDRFAASQQQQTEQNGHISDREPDFEDDGIHPPPQRQDFANMDAVLPQTQAQGYVEEPAEEPSARSRLLDFGHKYHLPHSCGRYNCNHGAFSPRPRFHRAYGSIASSYDGPVPDDRSEVSYGGRSPAESVDGSISQVPQSLTAAVTRSLLSLPSKKTKRRWLARTHGKESVYWLYLQYYIPSINWIRQYQWSYLEGDLTAALTMASFYIPMALSLASNLGHIPPINGLYTFVFNPLIYALLGTCPQMVVGPEAAGSLLTGSVVTEAIKSGTNGEYDNMKHAQVAGMVTGLAGAFILIAGICRLGFLDGVLSRPFLRGFISAIGITILVDQLIPEMGLSTPAKHSVAAKHGSSLDKILFLFRHGHEAHGLTCAVSFSTIFIVLFFRESKRRLQPRMKWVAYVPDRFIVVVLSAVFTWAFDWEHQGLSILGDIRSEGRPFKAHFPFDEGNFRHVNDAFSTAFIIALLGFFESSVAAKSLGASSGTTKKVVNKNGEEVEENDGIRDMSLSSNRELVALGVANLLGGLFMALPGFGGYGRSKVNASTGGKTPMSSIFLALITLICVLFLLPYFYYIPKGVLSAMISVVAYSLIEEAPHDIKFFYTVSGWLELALMTLIFVTTFLWNLKIGIAVGIGLSLLRLLKHSTRPRIQILGRVPGTKEFENAELLSGEDGEEGVVLTPHCLIVKIPEPLTFANTGSLKDRLKRLEEHGSATAHPAMPKRRRPEHNKNIIFDVHGVTSIDPAAVQVLLEIVEGYIERGTRVFFCRIPGRRTEVWRLMRVSGIVDVCGGEGNFYRSVDDALQATERQSTLRFNADEDDAEEGFGGVDGDADGHAGGGLGFFDERPKPPELERVRTSVPELTHTPATPISPTRENG